MISVLKECGFSEKKWYELGLKMGLLQITLEVIEQENHSVTRCMIKCISRWLKRVDNVISKGGLPCWNSLSDALRAIDEIAVADKLDQKSKFINAPSIMTIMFNRTAICTG